MINGINHITLSVSNIEESFNFYTKCLGCKPIMKSKKSSYVTISGIWIALQEECDLDHQNKTYAHIAFNVTKEDYDIIVNKLTKENVKEWKSNDSEGDSFYFVDPTGNKFELHYSDLNSRIEYGKRNWKNVEWYV